MQVRKARDLGREREKSREDGLLSKCHCSAEFCFALLNQRFKGLVQAHRLLDPEFLGKRQIQSKPPFSLVDSKRCAWRRSESVALKNTVQTILSLRSLLDQSVAMRHQSTQLAHCLWRHPHRRNEMGRKSTWPI